MSNSNQNEDPADDRGEDAPLLPGNAPVDEQQTKSQALKFVLMVGVMSLFADFTYEGARSITGQYMELLGASAFATGVITGLGEFLGYGLRLLSGGIADWSGMYWPITIGGYILQMAVVPLLAIAGNWQVAGLLIVLERTGKAIRSPPRNAMLSHAAKHIGYGWAFGVHEALDQIGALLGPMMIALILYKRHDDYRLSFAVLAAPAAIMLLILAVARWQYPRPQDLGGRPSPDRTNKLPRAFWVYLAASTLMAAGFANYPIIAYHFRHSETVSDTFIPIFYGIASAVSGIGSLVLGRLFDRVGIVILIPIMLLTASYAPMVFLGEFPLNLIGTCIWGLGVGVHQSTVPAVVATMVSPERRASAYGIFTSIYGLAMFIGSVVIGALLNTSVTAVAIFSIVTQVLAIPLIIIAQKLVVETS